MFTFVKLFDSSFSPVLKYNWCLQVKDISTLIQYEETIMSSYQARVFNDCLNSRELQYLSNSKGALKNHAIEKASYPILSKLAFEGGNIIDRCTDFFNSSYNAKVKVLNSYGTLFIQESKGFFGKNNNHTITDMREIEKLIWPNSSIIISKWANGRHYYARIGDTDVIWDGQGKWNSEEEAQLAAECFCKNNLLNCS